MTTAPSDSEPGVEGVLTELDDLAAEKNRVRIGDVLDDFGARSFGPFIMLPALIDLSPIGGIPGLPSLLALIIAITAAQLFLGKDHVWLPQFIQKRSVTGRRLHKAVRKLHGIARWMDEHSHGRLESLTKGIWAKVAAVVIVLLCCAVPPLDFVPFGTTPPMLAIAAFGLALTVRDGVLMLIALTLAGAAVGMGGYLLATNPIG